MEPMIAELAPASKYQPRATIEAGKNGVAVHVDVAGLQPNTEYQFRAVAENIEGLTEGSSKTFLTQACICLSA